MIVVWRVTERCNLACAFCAYDKTLDRSRRAADPAAIARFGRVLADLRAATGQPVVLSWLGGEPLLWPPLQALTEELHALGIALSVTTNGTTLGAESVREHVRSCYAELTISIDGPAGFHDRSRGWPGGFAALATSVRAIADRKRATGRGPLIRANLLLMRETIAGFEALCRDLATWGIEQVTFNQLGGFDRPEFWPAHRLLADQVAEVASELEGMRTRLRSCGVTVLGSAEYLTRMQHSARDLALEVWDCGPGQHFLFVDEQGRVAPCSFTVDSCGVAVAEIDDLAALRALPERFAARRAMARPAGCLDCHSTQVAGKFRAGSQVGQDVASAATFVPNANASER